MPTYSDRLLSADEQRFVRMYIKHRDLAKAALFAQLPASRGKLFWSRPWVREDIDRRLAMLEREQAHLDRIQAANFRSPRKR